MSKKKNIDVGSEWVHQVDVTNLGGKKLPVTLSAPHETCKKLLPRLGLLSLESVEADLVFARGDSSAVIHVTGRIRAELSQSCVVTLEPIKAQVDAPFEAWFADAQAAVLFAKARHDRKLSKGSGEMPMLDESEDPEPVIEGKIDAGELVVQHLLLSIDPYPHKEGTHYEIGDDTVKTVVSEPGKNPFAALKDWKARLGKTES